MGDDIAGRTRRRRGGLERQALRIAFWQMLILAAGIVALVPAFGLLGVALATMTGVLFINFAEYYSSRRSIGLYWRDRRYLGWLMPAVAACVLALSGKQIFQTPGMLTMACMLASLYLVFHGISLLQGLHSDDIELLAELRKKLLPKSAES